MTRQLVALLPLKAHSERVPGKNFRPLAGKPLVRWILDTLLNVASVDLVVINTDAATLLNDLGVEASDRVLIRERKPELCGDMVSMNLVLADDVEAVDAERYLMTHTTNPLISAATIESSLSAFENSAGADSLFSVNKTQTRFYREDGRPVNHDPDNLVRTQDLEPWFEENSCIYLFTKESFNRSRARIGNAPVMFETPPLESIDIDVASDWFLAEAIAEKLAREAQAQ